MTENERFGLVFTKTVSINSGTGQKLQKILLCTIVLRLRLQWRDLLKTAKEKSSRKQTNETFRHFCISVKKYYLGKIYLLGGEDLYNT